VFKDEVIPILASILQEIAIEGDRPVLSSQYISLDNRAGAITVVLSTRRQALALIARGVVVDSIPVSIALVQPPISETNTRDRHSVKARITLDSDRMLPLAAIQSMVTTSIQSVSADPELNPKVVTIVPILPDTWSDTAMFKVSFRTAAQAAAALAYLAHREVRYHIHGELQTLRMVVTPWEPRPDSNARSLSRGPTGDRGRAASRGRANSKGPRGNSNGPAPTASAAPATTTISVNQILGRVPTLNPAGQQRLVDVLVHCVGPTAALAMVNAAPGPTAPTPSVTRALAIAAKIQASNNQRGRPAATPNTNAAPNLASLAAPAKRMPIVGQVKPKATPVANQGPAVATGGRGRGRQGPRSAEATPVQSQASQHGAIIPTQWASAPAPFVQEDDEEELPAPAAPSTSAARARPIPAAVRPASTTGDPTLAELREFMLRMNSNFAVISEKLGVPLPSALPGDPESKNA